MLNNVTLIGRLGADPEVRYMPSGGAVTNINLATSRQWKNKETGKKQEETEWHRLSMFNRLAEVAGQYLKKGSLIYVEGRIRTRKWQDNNGQDRYTTEIIATQMQMLDTKITGQQAARQEPPKQQHPTPPPSDYEDFDDDIPL